MKALLLVSAVLLLACNIGQMLLRVSGSDSQARIPIEAATMSVVTTPESQREDSSADGKRTSRQTLEESLPAGSRIIETSEIPGGIVVVLKNGLCISARGASATSGGTSFNGPYEITKPMGGTLASKDVGSVCLLARDGSFKLIPFPDDTTLLSTPFKIEDGERAFPTGP